MKKNKDSIITKSAMGSLISLVYNKDKAWLHIQTARESDTQTLENPMYFNAEL